MATPVTKVYYTVSPTTMDAVSPDTLCERTYEVVVYTDSNSVNHLVYARFCQGYFNLWSDYVSKADLQSLAALPADVQAWLTLFSYNNNSFAVYQ